MKRLHYFLYVVVIFFIATGALKKDVYGNIEGLIDHFKLVMEGHKPPAGEIYMPIEGGNGELGFYLVSDGSGDPVRVRLRPPCFNFVAAMPEMTIGHYVADIVPIFGSVNMISLRRYPSGSVIKSSSKMRSNCCHLVS